MLFKAHSNGLAVVGEYSKEIAENFCKKLTEKGLLSEVVQKNDSLEQVRSND